MGGEQSTTPNKHDAPIHPISTVFPLLHTRSQHNRHPTHLETNLPVHRNPLSPGNPNRQRNLQTRLSHNHPIRHKLPPRRHKPTNNPHLRRNLHRASKHNPPRPNKPARPNDLPQRRNPQPRAHHLVRRQQGQYRQRRQRFLQRPGCSTYARSESHGLRTDGVSRAG